MRERIGLFGGTYAYDGYAANDQLVCHFVSDGRTGVFRMVRLGPLPGPELTADMSPATATSPAAETMPATATPPTPATKTD